MRSYAPLMARPILKTESAASVALAKESAMNSLLAQCTWPSTCGASGPHSSPMAVCEQTAMTTKPTRKNPSTA